MMFQNTGPQHIFEYLVDSLSLAIHLWVIGRTLDQVSSEGREQLLPKTRDKLRTSVGDYHLQNSVQAYHASYVDLYVPSRIIIGVNGYEVGRFGESVHDHPNLIRLAGSHG
jgi:hypothetical protein